MSVPSLRPPGPADGIDAQTASRFRAYLEDLYGRELTDAEFSQIMSSIGALAADNTTSLIKKFIEWTKTSGGIRQPGSRATKNYQSYQAADFTDGGSPGGKGQSSNPGGTPLGGTVGGGGSVGLDTAGGAGVSPGGGGTGTIGGNKASTGLEFPQTGTKGGSAALASNATGWGTTGSKSPSFLPGKGLSFGGVVDRVTDPNLDQGGTGGGLGISPGTGGTGVIGATTGTKGGPGALPSNANGWPTGSTTEAPTIMPNGVPIATIGGEGSNPGDGTKPGGIGIQIGDRTWNAAEAEYLLTNPGALTIGILDGLGYGSNPTMQSMMTPYVTAAFPLMNILDQYGMQALNPDGTANSDLILDNQQMADTATNVFNQMLGAGYEPVDIATAYFASILTDGSYGSVQEESKRPDEQLATVLNAVDLMLINGNPYMRDQMATLVRAMHSQYIANGMASGGSIMSFPEWLLKNTFFGDMMRPYLAEKGITF